MLRKPVGILVLVALAVLLYFESTRELVKITLFFLVPLVFLYAYGARLPRGGWGRRIVVAFMLLDLVGYGLVLANLPARIEAREITARGAVLMASGQYDAAAREYARLGEIGFKNKMEEKLADVEQEKGWQQTLDKAHALADAGDYAGAEKLLDSIPRTAGCYREAQKLRSSFPQAP